MSEECDSRTATLGRKRAFNTNQAVVDLISSSDSSDGQPVQKRPRREPSKSVSGQASRRQDRPFQSAEIEEQEDFISLMSDDSDAESGEVAEDEQPVKSSVADRSQRPLDPYDPESTQNQNFSSDESTSAEDDSEDENDSIVQGISETDATRPAQEEEQVSPGSGDSSRAAPTGAVDAKGLFVKAQAGVYIPQLPSNATKNDLLTLFKDYKVLNVELRKRGKAAKLFTALLILPSQKDARRAIAALNGQDILGRKVTLQFSHIPALRSKQNPNSAVDYAIREAIGSAQKVKKLRQTFGDEYVEAVSNGVTEKSVHPIPLSDEKRSSSILNFAPKADPMSLPDMMANNSPVPFSELSIDTYIPLFLRANSRHALLLVQRPTIVTEAFRNTISFQYRHLPAASKSQLLGTTLTYDKANISAFLIAAMAKIMPDTLRGLTLDDFDFKTPIGMAVRGALEELGPITGKGLEDYEQVSVSKVLASQKEPVVTSDKDASKKPASSKKKKKEGAAAVPIRSAPDSKTGKVPRPNLAPDHDMHLQSEDEPEVADDEMQMRYFPPSQFSSSRRCSTCGATDHRTQQCGPITCDSCGKVDVHFTWACPQKVRCRRCQEQGHTSTDCPEKLQRTKVEDIQCVLCNSLDHQEWVCPQLWRSYEAPAMVRKVAGLRINCAFCGDDGHYGNDCGLRSSEYAPATFIFSINDAQQYIDPSSKHRALDAGKDYTIKTKKKTNGFAIKGRAATEAINRDYGSDDGAFLGPPVKKIQTGQRRIQISNTSMGRYQNSGQYSSQSFSRDHAPHPQQTQYGRGRDSPPPVAWDEDEAYVIRGGGYRGEFRNRDAIDHYEPQRGYGGQNFTDYHDNRSAAPPHGGGSRGGGYRGGNGSRGGNASRGRNAPRPPYRSSRG